MEYIAQLHNKTCKLRTAELLISKINQIYKTKQISQLQNLMNYYNLFLTQVPVPVSNLIILRKHPFLMLNTEEYWTTLEQCPEVENFYYCQQAHLYKNQACLADIIKNDTNNCHGITIQLNETRVKQINFHQVLVIPVRSVSIQANCEANGIFEVNRPSVITLENGRIEMDNKVFQLEEMMMVFELTKLNVTANPYRLLQPIRLKNINKDDLKQIHTIADNLHTSNLDQPYNGQAWTNTSITISIIVTCCAAAIYMKNIRPKMLLKQEKLAADSQNRREPLFSKLKVEKVM